MAHRIAHPMAHAWCIIQMMWCGIFGHQSENWAREANARLICVCKVAGISVFRYLRFASALSHISTIDIWPTIATYLPI
jgi:hypothetical protein